MNLELLPDEIFLDLFDYFNGIDLLDAFYGLNSRFNWLLYKQYRTYRLNCTLISKTKFHSICHEHLPFIVDRVISLYLSDDDDTPQQIDCIYSAIQSIKQFRNLRALSLSGIRTYKRLIQIIDECHQLCHLTYFRFNLPPMSDDATIYQSIIDKIWALPKLTCCEFIASTDYDLNIWTSTNIVSSIERLSFSKSVTELKRINSICQCTQRLKYLSISVRDFDDVDGYIPCLLPMLSELNIRVGQIFDISNIISLLQNMPNLRALSINLIFNTIDAYQWEDTISNYLRKLKKFQFKMIQYLCSYRNLEEQINELIGSFQSHFWTHEHQWFVRCFSCQQNIYVCTPSYVLTCGTNSFPDIFLSTDPNDNLQRFADQIIGIEEETYFDHPIPANIHLTNLQHLCIQFPIHDQLWLRVPHLNRLKSLTICVDEGTSPSQLQTLFDQAPNLYKLTIYHKSFEFGQSSNSIEHWYMELLNCTHPSIRHLIIDQSPRFSTKEECIEVAQSSLGAQCEILIIKTHNRESIVNLVKNLINLRALTIYCDYSINDYGTLSPKTHIDPDNREVNFDEIMQWLKERLPSTCSMSCERFAFGTSTIRIWIT